MAWQTSATRGGGSVDPIRWAKARDIFHGALDTPSEEREAYVFAACGDDAGLRAEVLSLLASDGQAGDFIEQPAVTLLASDDRPAFVPRLANGTRVGRFEVQDFLGAGGISEVYRARDTRLGRTVALKLVTDPHDPDAGARLLVEAQHASILNHSHICGVHEAEDRDGLPFIVLELVEGPTLHEVMKNRRLSIDEVVKWGREIASALDHAHRRGVIHRDLKSANVAVAPDGSVKVLDFGLSRRVADGDQRGHAPADILTSASVAGTLTHIAPEVLRGEPLDPRVDLWALGVMLYEMAGGGLPFKRATALQTADAILETEPEPLPSSVPADLQQLIGQCLAKDPAARFGSAAEVREALGAVRLDTRVHTRGTRARVAVGGALAVVIGGALLATGWPLVPGKTELPVIAVLPFEASAGVSDEAFVAAGVTDGLIAELGRVDGIRVLAPTTAARFRTGAVSNRDTARSAGATRLLEGSIARDSGEVRLSARLSDASTGRVIWSEDYRRDARQLQPLQGVVAAAVARAVDVELNADDAKRFSAVRAVDPDVYEAYLKGRFYWSQRTPASIRTAITHFEAALKLDPTYAPAYVAVADCYNQLATQMVGAGSPRLWRPRAAEAAIKALQIEPDLAEAHATLGYVHHYDWEWEDAEKAFRRAISLNPNNALTRIWYSNFLCSRKRFDEAIREVMVARDLDPFSAIVQTNVGWTLFRARRNDEAIDAYKKALTLDPNYLQAHMRLAGSYGVAGRFDEAIAESETVTRVSKSDPLSLVALEQMRLLAGRPNQFESRLSEAIALGDAYVPPGGIANAYITAHRYDEGLDWLEKSFRERTNNMVYLGVEPVYDGVRDHPRFKAFVQAIGLP